jgi:hypothetical protein
MGSSTRKKRHDHKQITVRVILQRDGVPYEVERTLCADCEEIISERPVRRAAA